MDINSDHFIFPAECSRCNAPCATKNWELSTSTSQGTLTLKVPIGEACERKLHFQVAIRLVLINLGVYLGIQLLSWLGLIDSWYLSLALGLMFSAASLTYLSSLRHKVGSKEIGMLSTVSAGIENPQPVLMFHSPAYQQKFASLNPEVAGEVQPISTPPLD